MMNSAIHEIDKRINALRKRIPDVSARLSQEKILFRERGIAQLDRDLKEEQERCLRAAKPLRKVTCPTCGSSVYGGSLKG